MSSNTLKARYKHPVKSAAKWTEENPILLTGEIGVESDTGKCKAGDGVSSWNTLTYLNRNVANEYIPNAGNTITGNLALSRSGNIGITSTGGDITIQTTGTGKAYYNGDTANDEIATIGDISAYVNSLDSNNVNY